MEDGCRQCPDQRGHRSRQKPRGEERGGIDGDREVRQADRNSKQDGYADAHADEIFVRDDGDEVSG